MNKPIKRFVDRPISDDEQARYKEKHGLPLCNFEVIEEREISKSGPGVIKELTVRIGDRLRSFVVKSLTHWGTGAPINIEKSYEKWEKLKDLGIPTYPTFRIDHIREKILMTNMNRGEMCTVSENNPSEAKEKLLAANRKLTSQERNHLQQQILGIADLAARNGIFIPMDSYLFSIPLVAGEVDAKVFVGDLDRVDLNSPEQAERGNKSGAEFCLGSLADQLEFK